MCVLQDMLLDQLSYLTIVCGVPRPKLWACGLHRTNHAKGKKEWEVGDLVPKLIAFVRTLEMPAEKPVIGDYGFKGSAGF